jgi:transcriptional regulator with XRE-family HTH domain
MAVHDRLKEERERLFISQADFAEKAGVSRNTQVRYETGKTAPSSSYLEIVKRLGIDVDYVLFDVPDGEVVCTYLESQGIDRKITPSECRQRARGGHSFTKWWHACLDDCPKNPLKQKITYSGSADVDGSLLAAIIAGIDVELGKAGKKATAEKKAQAVVMVYRASKSTGVIDDLMLSQAAVLAAD